MKADTNLSLIFFRAFFQDMWYNDKNGSYLTLKTGGGGMNRMYYDRKEKHEYLETFEKTSMELFLVQIGTEQCEPNHTVTSVHDDYVIHFVLSGQGFYSVNAKLWTVTAGQMFLIRPGEPVVYGADRFHPWTYGWIGFKGVRADSLLKQSGFSKDQLVLSAPDAEEIMACFDEVFQHITPSYSDTLCRESLLLKVFSVLVKNHEQSLLKQTTEQAYYSENQYIRIALDYISESYMKGIGVTAIAQQVGVTRAHLNRIFQENFQISVQNYLMEFRMGKAESLLVSTTTPVKDIAGMVGYTDPLVFSKAFKRRYDASPKNYRDANKR